MSECVREWAEDDLCELQRTNEMPLVGSKSGLLWPLLVHAAGLAAYFV